VTESKKVDIETNDREPFDLGLGPLGDSIAEATIGHDDVTLSGAFSRQFSPDDKTKIALIFKKQGQAGIGPDIIIQKQAIETIDGEDVLRSYVLRWPKDFPKSADDVSLLIISPTAKKDMRRNIRGSNLDKYSKDLHAAQKLVTQAREALKSFEDFNG
jgi:hypothetical protein